jgi:hypothetical protein
MTLMPSRQCLRSKPDPELQVFTRYLRSGHALSCGGRDSKGDATTQETKYELVLKIIAGLELNDDTPHIQKLQLCLALARGVLELKPGDLRPSEQPEYGFGDKLKIPHEKRN